MKTRHLHSTSHRISHIAYRTLVGAILAICLLTGQVEAGNDSKNSLLSPNQPGQYHVGYTELNFIDQNRIDTEITDPNTGKVTISKRPIKVSVWYPIDNTEAKKGIPIIYSIDPNNAELIPLGVESHLTVTSEYGALGALVGKESRMVDSTNPKVRCNNNRTNCVSFSYQSLKPSTNGPFPMILNSHGNVGSSLFVKSLAEIAASHGFVFVSVNHIGDRNVDHAGGACTQVGRADPQAGTITVVTTSPRPCRNSAANYGYNRTVDISYVLDRMLELNRGIDPQKLDSKHFFKDRIQPSAIGLTGHSYGGVTDQDVTGGRLAVTSGALTVYPAIAKDKRIKAVMPVHTSISELATLDQITIPILVEAGNLDFRTPIFGNRELFEAVSSAKTGVKYFVNTPNIHKNVGFEGTLSIPIERIANMFAVGNDASADSVVSGYSAARMWQIWLDFPTPPPVGLEAFQLYELMQTGANPNHIYENLNFWQGMESLVDTEGGAGPGTGYPVFQKRDLPGFIDSTYHMRRFVTDAESNNIRLNFQISFLKRYVANDTRFEKYLLTNFADQNYKDVRVRRCITAKNSAETCSDNVVATKGNPIDLSPGDSIIFTPIGNGKYLVQTLKNVAFADKGAILPSIFTGESMGDEDLAILPLSFSFPFPVRSQQVQRSELVVESNGAIGFDSSDERIEQFLNYGGNTQYATDLLRRMPRIMPLGTDLNPDEASEGAGEIYGWVDSSVTPQRAIITWDAVRRFEFYPFTGIGVSDPSSFQVILSADGKIQFIYGELARNFDQSNTAAFPYVEATIGISDGTAPIYPREASQVNDVDFTALTNGGKILPVGAIYQTFTVDRSKDDWGQGGFGAGR